MKARPAVLVADDDPRSLKLVVDLLALQSCEVSTARSGDEALALAGARRFDLVLLDVMMPAPDGYEVCRRLRAADANRMLPIVLITALDQREARLRGLQAGADDFISKPIETAELLARVRSLLRIKSLYDTVEDQAAQLAEWNTQLERRVGEQVSMLARMDRLRRFLPPQLAQLLIAGSGADPLASHRREVVVVFLDLRGFTRFADSAAPEEVMRVLGEFHAEMGRLAQAHEGTLERFTGDGIMIFFNDPQAVDDPAGKAIRMTLQMRDASERMSDEWRRRGFDLGLGIGIAQGEATIGAIGFENRVDYGAIGTVTNLAARLCAEARAGQILIEQRALGAVRGRVEAAPLEPLRLRGFDRPVAAASVLSMRAGA